MPLQNYSFLDVVALDGVREHFLAARPVIVLSQDLSTLLWANGPGAGLVGFVDVESAAGAALDISTVAKRQILAGGLPALGGAERPLSVRLTSRLPSRLLTMAARTLVMPDGASALMLAVVDGASDLSTAIDGFSTPDHHAAIVDGDGRMHLASTGFSGLSLSADALRALSAATGGRRVAKKAIEAAGRVVAAGIAQLSDDPERYLLLVIDEESAATDQEYVAASDGSVDPANDAHEWVVEAIAGDSTEDAEASAEVLAVHSEIDPSLDKLQEDDNGSIPELAPSVVSRPGNVAAPTEAVSEDPHSESQAIAAPWQSAADEPSLEVDAGALTQSDVKDELPEYEALKPPAEGTVEDHGPVLELFSETTPPTSEENVENSFEPELPFPLAKFQPSAQAHEHFDEVVTTAQTDGDEGEPLTLTADTDALESKPPFEFEKPASVAYTPDLSSAPFKSASADKKEMGQSTDEPVSFDPDEELAAPEAIEAFHQDVHSTDVETGRSGVAPTNAFIAHEQGAEASHDSTDGAAGSDDAEHDGTSLAADSAAFDERDAIPTSDVSADEEPVAIHEVDVEPKGPADMAGYVTQSGLPEPLVTAQSAQADSPPAALEERAALAGPQTASDAFDRSMPLLRFVWRTDAGGRIRSISQEFLDAMKIRDNLIGEKFGDVAARAGFDQDNEIARLLTGRDTWSGRTVSWPVPEAGLLVPVDLAALPAYSRERTYEGFRGFGVARFVDAVESLDLASPHAASAIPFESEAAVPVSEPPALEIASQPDRRASDRVVRLAEKAASAISRGLSTHEETAFREIGDRLREDPDSIDQRSAEERSESDELRPASTITDEDQVRPATSGVVESNEPRGGASRAQDDTASLPSTDPAGCETVDTARQDGDVGDTTNDAQSFSDLSPVLADDDRSNDVSSDPEPGADDLSNEITGASVDSWPAMVPGSIEPPVAEGDVRQPEIRNVEDATVGLSSTEPTSEIWPQSDDVLAVDQVASSIEQETLPTSDAQIVSLADDVDGPAEFRGPLQSATDGESELEPHEFEERVETFDEPSPDGEAADIDIAEPAEIGPTGDVSNDPIDEADIPVSNCDRDEPSAESAPHVATAEIEHFSVDSGGDAIGDDSEHQLPPHADLSQALDVDEAAAPRSEQSEVTVGEPLVSAIEHVDSEAGDEPPAVMAVSDAELAVLRRLPVPVLIHRGDDLLFANDEFLDLTGYRDLDALTAAGGMGELFADDVNIEAVHEDHSLAFRTSTGIHVPIHAHLRSIPWGDGKALMLVVRRSEPETPVAIIPDNETAELRDRLSEMRAIIDTATDGVILIEPDGAIRSISRPAEALLGFESSDVAGKPFISLFAMESQRSAREYLAGLADNGVASVLNDGREVIGREAQGRFIPLFMTIGKLPDDNGYCAVVRDITQWKRAEEDLTQARSLAERASSQKTDFLARVSHEIRTPLNAIIGFSELMVEERFGALGNERYRDYLRDINRSGNHVLEIVNDLLDISKIEAGEHEMTYEAVSLNDALVETVALMQPQANRERVIIRSSYASRLPEVVADRRSVRQIALNLLSNAVRYTQAGGQVIVSTAHELSGEVVLRVRDTGIGMSPGEIEQALKPFKRVHTLRRPRGDGTGLGLPLTKAMVEANRARFSIVSTPGEGTLVEIIFPTTRVLAD